jgi:hypothetical protein
MISRLASNPGAIFYHPMVGVRRSCQEAPVEVSLRRRRMRRSLWVEKVKPEETLIPLYYLPVVVFAGAKFEGEE